MPLTFLDTNVLLRHLLGDHAEQSPRCTAYLERVERGEREARTADTVVFETVFTLVLPLQRTKAEIREQVLPGKRHYQSVFDL